MREISIRELRNHGGEAIDRVAAGDVLIVTRSGRAVAELRPFRSRGLDAATLLQRWRRLPALDPDRLRADLDDVLDARP
ncbi:MAG TPA: type II toxin-antitoxin system prevent-host-death family antitoxin [Candidatus Limnocylindrales bacterium]|nr:type II toxin-antitoxin system prevent-host-death family antitoxin [Candidatus Limnocylindrales bacterium]